MSRSVFDSFSWCDPQPGKVWWAFFFTLGLTIHDWGWPKNGPFWTKNGQTWQACQRSKVVQRGPKGTKMVNLSLFEHLGPFWAHLDPFGPFQTRIDILLWSTSAKPYFVHFGQKNQIAWKSTKGTIASLEWRLLVWHKGAQVWRLTICPISVESALNLWNHQQNALFSTQIRR